MVGGQAEVSPDRGLQARAIKDLTFDLRRGHSFFADEVDREQRPIICADVFKSAADDTRMQEKVSLQTGKFFRRIAKVRPAFLLPVPNGWGGHERKRDGLSLTISLIMRHNFNLYHSSRQAIPTPRVPTRRPAFLHCASSRLMVEKGAGERIRLSERP